MKVGRWNQAYNDFVICGDRQRDDVGGHVWQSYLISRCSGTRRLGTLCDVLTATVGFSCVSVQAPLQVDNISSDSCCVVSDLTRLDNIGRPARHPASSTRRVVRAATPRHALDASTGWHARRCGHTSWLWLPRAGRCPRRRSVRPSPAAVVSRRHPPGSTLYCHVLSSLAASGLWISMTSGLCCLCRGSASRTTGQMT